MFRTRAVAVIATLSLAGYASLAGCGGAEPPPASGTTPPASATTESSPPDVVSHLGLGPIRFGDTREHLERDHGLVQDPGDCAARLPAYPSASPVFDGGRLVLLWADPPLRTPDGLAVGAPVDQVHSTHPDAEALPAGPDSFRFDALLAPVDDRAYLFLHDGRAVQKVIVGYEDHARRVLDENFGTC